MTSLDNDFSKNYKYELNSCFEPIFTDNYRFLIYYGGRGGEKSWGIADSLVFLSRMEKKTILVTREVQTSIAESCKSLLENRIKFHGYTNEFKITNNSIEHSNGSRFIFKGLNDINDKTTQAIKGLEDIDICFCEEAQTLTHNSLKVLIPTIRKPNSKLIFALNPLYSDDAIMDFIENPRPRSYIAKLYYYDNIYASDELLEEAENCKRFNPSEFEHIWLGHPLDLAKNAVVKNFDHKKQVLKLNYQNDIDLYLTCDFNVATMSWAIAHRDSGNTYFIDEMAVENTCTQECIDIFIAKYRGHKGNIIVTGDASGGYRSTQSQFHNYKIIKNALEKAFNPDKISFKLKKANPPKLARVEAFNACVLDNRGKRRIYIDKDCKTIIWAIKNQRYTDDGKGLYEPTTKDIENRAMEKWTSHMFDAVTYLIDNFDPVS